MTLPDDLTKVATEARCPNEHTAHKNDGPLKRTWVTCADEELASRIWDTSSGYDLSDEIRWFFKSTLDEHHRATWPRYAVAAVLRALPESEAVKEAAREMALRRLHDYHCGCGQYDAWFVLADTTEFDLTIDAAIAAIAKLADDE